MAAPNIAQLRRMKDDELIRLHDHAAKNTAATAEYFLDELRYRDQARIVQRMTELSRRLWWLAVIITVATVLNLAFALGEEFWSLVWTEMNYVLEEQRQATF